jgi:hypothetical protein
LFISCASNEKSNGAEAACKSNARTAIGWGLSEGVGTKHIGRRDESTRNERDRGNGGRKVGRREGGREGSTLREGVREGSTAEEG